MVTDVAEEATAEHAHGVRQCRVMRLVVLLRVFDVMVMDEAATVEFLFSAGFRLSRPNSLVAKAASSFAR